MKPLVKWVIVVAIILVFIFLWFHYKSTAWERDLTVKETVAYSDYEITNNTNHTLSDIKVIFACEDVLGRKWKYTIERSKIGPHETITVHVNFEDLISQLNEKVEASWPTYKLERVKYRR
jgi:hypothetical protein